MNKQIYSRQQRKLVEKLKKARQARKLDQTAAAKKLGKTQSYISKIEAGQRRIDIFQLKEFSKIYKKNLNYFIK